MFVLYNFFEKSQGYIYFFIISFSLLYNGCELWLLLTLFSVYNTDFSLTFLLFDYIMLN
nr:MAG TPA: hypothetical protein [Caudoviricetes sp.]